jgi:hypothetical protein
VDSDETGHPGATPCAGQRRARLVGRCDQAGGGHPARGSRPAGCIASRSARGFLVDFGSCWYRLHPWSPPAWRAAGPHG